jgi:MoaA/NifB/PqqE/SkfB family radical SAM enzyme
VAVKNFFRKLVKALLPYGIIWLYRKNKLLAMKLKPKKMLQFEVHLADHCNLNCKYCDHFSPVAGKEFLDIAVFEKDCARISELTGGRLEYIYLLGGEPLLHPDINAVIHTARKYFKDCEITIYTNGILLLKQDEIFWKSCGGNNIAIAISGYPITLDIESINQKAREYNVKIQFLAVAKSMYKIHLDIEGKQNSKENFISCWRSNNCIFLEDGKLYTCTKIPNIKHFNRYFNKKLEVSEGDYIDIYKAKNIKEVLKFLCKPAPFCRYCKINEYEHGLTWGVSKKEISEWT